MNFPSAFTPKAVPGSSADPVPPRPQRLSISYRAIDELKPNPTNPRRHSPSQIRRLRQMIKRFGFRVPLLIDANATIIAGHGRWQAARLEGLPELPTITIEDLTEAEVKAFIIGDNRIAELSTWDDKVLAEQFLELSQISPDLSLELTGFDMAEIDFRIESLQQPAAGGPDPADIVPAAAGSPVTRPGDLWLLGPHRVVCGDARDAGTYAALLDGKRAAAVFTDPPYNVAIQGHASGLGQVQHREFAMASGEMTDGEFTNFLRTTLRQLAEHAGDGALIYFCMDWRHLQEALEAARSLGVSLVNICVWVKHNAGMGSFYRSQHELVLVLKRGRGRHLNNVQLGRYGRNRSNVWHYRGANDFGRGAGEGNLIELHPTAKPVAMVADAIMDCTKRGDIVLDAFLGSGTTLIAAERTGRTCCAIEIDPLYVDTAVRRWQSWTRGAAHHAATGLSFDETAQQREGGHEGG